MCSDARDHPPALLNWTCTGLGANTIRTAKAFRALACGILGRAGGGTPVAVKLFGPSRLGFAGWSN